MIKINIGEQVKFKCVPVTERFYSEDSSYGVFVFHTKDNIPKYDDVPENTFDSELYAKNNKMSVLAGNMQQLYLGVEYEVTATLEYNAKYKSYQYKPKIVTATKPKSEQQQKCFLKSVVSEKQAETLLEHYPNIVQDIVAGNDNVDVSILKGIGDKTYAKIKEKVLDNYVISDILVLLQPLGVTFSKIKKLISNEPNPSLLKEKLINNPYIMLEIKGFGFKTVDQLALKLNPEIKVSSKRTYAFINYFFSDMGNNQGHTWTTVDNLECAIRDNINECMETFHKIIDSEREIEKVLHFEGDKVGLLRYYENEKNIFNILNSLQSYKSLKVSKKDIDDGILQSEKDQGFPLTEEQRELVTKSMNHNVVIVTGSAGTGKTSVSRAILNVYKKANYSISCCALSAMAAQRIIEATGFQASTIHRLLGYNSTGFMYNYENPLDCDVLFVDECSMINAYIFYSVVCAVKEGKKIVLCGDNKQLPPIGYGNVFNDLLHKSEEFTVLRLTKVLRQAEDSGILMDANKIRKGIYPIGQPELKIINGKLKDMIYMFRDTREGMTRIAINTYMKSIQEDGMDNVAIIVPRRKNCENSTDEINKKIVDLVCNKMEKSVRFSNKTFYVGSKVTQMDNNYDKNVFNGEIGYITKIEEVTDENEKNVYITVKYSMNNETKYVVYQRKELDQIDFAYALTVHKTQGQSIKTVIIIIDMTHYTLLDTCLLYTAITRAKKRCLLLSEPKAFKMCMENNKSKTRNTWLSIM
ncbi:AAA family ATPase [Blautia caecimuris]|uniref:AAA family ATPase n=1 Tax=Blautia caecimuris TaxID=1796615 RepID=UPI0036F2A686